ncbi:MAG: helix-turn-helix domain-containing protein [Oscillospiraceae bacterium]|nr:helix-turn-helix domain-containing protein [Oscillospiraceae bacterium]
MFDLGNHLRNLRNDKSLTQKQVAEMINAGLRNYIRYETNARKPSYEFLIALADLYDVSLDYLVGRSDEPEKR